MKIVIEIKPLYMDGVSPKDKNIGHGAMSGDLRLEDAEGMDHIPETICFTLIQFLRTEIEKFAMNHHCECPTKEFLLKTGQMIDVNLQDFQRTLGLEEHTRKSDI